MNYYYYGGRNPYGYFSNYYNRYYQYRSGGNSDSSSDSSTESNSDSSTESSADSRAAASRESSSDAYSYWSWWHGQSSSSRGYGSSSYSSSNLRVVQTDPGDGSACAVCAIACATGVSYAKAWNTARNNGFTREGGMRWSQVEATLDDLGVSNTRHSSTPDWDDLPDLALISVHRSGTLHAVVFERRSDGRQYIYDNHNYSPVGTSGYSVAREDGYIQIR